MKRILYNDLYIVGYGPKGNMHTEKINYGRISAKKAKKMIDKIFKKGVTIGNVISRCEITFRSEDGRETRYKYIIAVDWGTEYREYTYMTAVRKE